MILLGCYSLWCIAWHDGHYLAYPMIHTDNKRVDTWKDRLLTRINGEHGNARTTLHTSEPTCTQPNIEQHTTEPITDKMAVHGRIDFAPKTFVFRAFMSYKNNRSQSIVFSDSEKYIGRSQWRQRIVEGKKGICKHILLSKQIAAAVCKASSVVCRAMFWAHLCSVVCSVHDLTRR